MFGVLGFNLFEGSGVPGFRLGLRILGFNFLGWVWDFSVQTYLVFWDFLVSAYLGIGILGFNLSWEISGFRLSWGVGIFWIQNGMLEASD